MIETLWFLYHPYIWSVNTWSDKYFKFLFLLAQFPHVQHLWKWQIWPVVEVRRFHGWLFQKPQALEVRYEWAIKNSNIVVHGNPLTHWDPNLKQMATFLQKIISNAFFSVKKFEMGKSALVQVMDWHQTADKVLSDVYTHTGGGEAVVGEKLDTTEIIK